MAVFHRLSLQQPTGSRAPTVAELLLRQLQQHDLCGLRPEGVPDPRVCSTLTLGISVSVWHFWYLSLSVSHSRYLTLGISLSVWHFWYLTLGISLSVSHFQYDGMILLAFVYWITLNVLGCVLTNITVGILGCWFCL